MMEETITGVSSQARMMGKCLINGNWVPAISGETLDVINPANGQLAGVVPLMGETETRSAIEAAGNAFVSWSKQTAVTRADVLMRWYHLMLENADQLAGLLTLEQGKPLAEARGEVGYAASFLRFYAEETRRVYGEIIPSPDNKSRIVVLKQPIGVVACITPWNFPAAMITRKAAPAIAAGCTVVMKPSELTPLSAIAIALLAQEAGLPDGVLNILTGNAPEIGGEMCANPIVRKMSFTGSTQVGRLLSAQCAPTVKKMALELGGNAPFIVFEDATLMPPSPGQFSANIAIRGKPAFAPTGFSFTRMFMTCLRKNLPMKCGN